MTCWTSTRYQNLVVQSLFPGSVPSGFFQQQLHPQPFYNGKFPYLHGHTIPKTNIASINDGFQEESPFPGVYFQVRAVSFREGTGWVYWWEVAKTIPGSGLSVGAKKLRMPDSALSCSIWSEYRACRPSWLLAAHALPSRKKYHRNRCKHMQTLSKLTKNTCWTVPSIIWQSQLKNSLFTSLVLWRRFNMHIWRSPFTYHGNLRASSNAIPSY